MKSNLSSAMSVMLLPCPFCGSTDIDAEGWASVERKGPACMDCNGSADTVERWNTRPLDKSHIDEARRFVLEKPSASYLQRRMQIRYKLALQYLNIFEREGLITVPNAAGVRSVIRGGA